MNEETQASLLFCRNRIETVLIRYARSLDSKDWELYRACLSERVNIDFEPLSGVGEANAPVDAMLRWAKLFFAPIKTQHVYSNFDIVVNGDSARAIVYLTARVWRNNALGSATSAEYGWYNFSLVKDNDDWRISGIKVNFFWVEGSGSVADVHDPEYVAAMREVFSPENIVAAKSLRA